MLNEYNAFGVQLVSKTRLIEDLGVDSLTILELVARLESVFNIEIGDSELTRRHFGTCGQLTAFIVRRVGNSR